MDYDAGVNDEGTNLDTGVDTGLDTGVDAGGEPDGVVETPNDGGGGEEIDPGLEAMRAEWDRAASGDSVSDEDSSVSDGEGEDGDSVSDGESSVSDGDSAATVEALIRAGLDREDAEAMLAGAPELAAKLAAKHPAPEGEGEGEGEEPVGDAEKDAEAEKQAFTERVSKAKEVLKNMELFNDREIEALSEAMTVLAGGVDQTSINAMVEQAAAPVMKLAEQFAPIQAAVEELMFRQSLSRLTDRFPELSEKGSDRKVAEQVGKIIKAGNRDKFESIDDLVESAAAIAFGSGRAKKLAESEAKKRAAKENGSSNVRPSTRESDTIPPEVRAFREEYERQMAAG